MIRTQIYIPEELHRQLLNYANKNSQSMAGIVREFIQEGIEKNTPDYKSGKETLKAMLKSNFRGGPKDLSKNLDHYLYGGPKK